MQKADVRAVENPISAIFDLAEDVYTRAPKVRRLVTYSRAFIYLWLIIDFVLIVFLGRHAFVSFLLILVVTVSMYSLRWGERRETRLTFLILSAVVSVFLALFATPEILLVAAVLVVLYYLGWIVLDLLHDLRKFFDYYELRHKVIKAVRSADPVVKVPPGPDPVSRLMAYLGAASPETAHVLSTPNAITRPAAIQGKSGVVHSFDAVVYAAPSTMWSLISWAYPGWCMLIKTYDGPPRLDDLKYLKHAAEDVVSAMKVPPSRVIALWTMKEGQSIAEDAYQFLTSEVVRFAHRGDTFLCTMESIAETHDNTYDLVPFVAQVSR